MEQWITELSNGSQGIAALFSAFVLGFLGLATSCCNVPVFTAIVGYSGAVAAGGRRRDLLIAAFFFMLGVILTLLLVGILVSLFGQFVMAGIGKYWKLVAGVLFIFFGLVTLQLLPIRVSLFKQGFQTGRTGIWPAILFGVVLASSSTACNSLCNPVFSLTLGAAFIQSNVFWGALILLFFGLGFGLPLAIGMAGLSFGFNQIASRLEKITVYIKYGGGILLLGLGFYFLLTL